MSNLKSNRGRNLVVLTAVVILIGLAFGARFKQLGQGTAMASIRSEQERLGVPVETAVADRQELAHWTTLAGTVEGITQYSVVSGNALRVVGIPVTEGSHVVKGDVIVRLADETPNPMFHSVSRSRANYENAQRDTHRMRNLYAEGAIAKQELDAVETRLRVAAADLQDAEGSTVLTASQSGIVTAILIEEGETVGANKPLVWIADTREVHVSFTAGSNQALSLNREQLAIWQAPDGRLIEGKLTQMDLMADPDTHLLAGKVTFPNSNGRLVPGLLVSFRVRTDYSAAVITVPTASLTLEGDTAAVWLITGTGTGTDQQAQKRSVATGLRTTDLVEIVSGLEIGDLVVVHGQTSLKDGIRVNDVTDLGGL